MKGVSQMSNTKKIVTCGIFIAVVAIATIFIKFPTAIGYINAGDGFILISALLLGPLAALVGGVGSALADLILGYTLYVPATLIIKGLIGLGAGLFLRDKNLSLRNILVFALCELWMVAGYFIFEAFIYSPASALGSVLPNLLQAAGGVVIAALGAPVVKQLSR